MYYLSHKNQPFTNSGKEEKVIRHDRQRPEYYKDHSNTGFS
jgi:hypothetical protein